MAEEFKASKEFDRAAMAVALAMAAVAAERGDYAIGACLARNGKIVAQGGNRVRTKNDSTKHVELEVIQYAVGSQHERYLTGCTLYSTHAPCPMCLTAAVWAGVDRVVYGLTQADIRRFGEKYGNDKFRWRGVDIEPEVLYELALQNVHPMEIEQLMGPECWARIVEITQPGDGPGTH